MTMFSKLFEYATGVPRPAVWTKDAAQTYYLAVFRSNAVSIGTSLIPGSLDDFAVALATWAIETQWDIIWSRVANDGEVLATADNDALDRIVNFIKKDKLR